MENKRYEGKKVLHMLITCVLPDNFEGTLADALRWIADYDETHTQIEKVEPPQKVIDFVFSSFHPRFNHMLRSGRRLSMTGSYDHRVGGIWKTMLDKP